MMNSQFVKKMSRAFLILAWLSVASAVTAQPRSPKERTPPPGIANAPLIAEFSRVTEACPVPDASQPVLSFKVINHVTRVVVSAVYRDGSDRVIYDQSAPAGTSWPSKSEDGIRDPDPNRLGWAGAIDQYKIEVTSANGQKASAYLSFAYATRISFEILSTEVSNISIPVSGGATHEYRVRYRGENIRGINVHIDFSSRDPYDATPHNLSAVTLGEDYLIVRTDINYDYFLPDGPVTFTYTANGYRNACKVEREELVREVPLLAGASKESSRSKRDPKPMPDPKPDPKPMPPPTPPPAPSPDLPDLVPVIDAYDGYSVTFHIENRGRVAVTRPFVITIDPLFGRPSFSVDFNERIETGSSSASITRDIGFGSTAADSVAVSVDTLGQVRESDERNNTATARTKKR